MTKLTTDDERLNASPHPPPTVDLHEMLATVDQWQAWARRVAGETHTDEHKSQLYSDLCSLGNQLLWLRDELSAIATPTADGMREALEKIAGGHFPWMAALAIDGDWQLIANRMQQFALAALASYPTNSPKEPT